MIGNFLERESVGPSTPENVSQNPTLDISTENISPEPTSESSPENISPDPTLESSTENISPNPTSESWSPETTSEYPDNDYDSETDGREEDLEDWPYGMIEVTSVVGKCVIAKHMSQRMRSRKPKDGFMDRVCPRMFEAAKLYTESDDVTREHMEDLAEENFGLLQCVNLLAIRDHVKAILSRFRPGKFKDSKPGVSGELGTTGPELGEMTKVLWEEAKELFDLCEETYADAFESVEEWEFGLEKEIEEESEPEPNERYLNQILRQLSKQKSRRG